MRWFNHEVFGIENPPVGHDLNPRVRSSSVKVWKKAISFFMPNKLMPWNQLSQAGNPTRSTELNELIKYMLKKEVRKQGVPSQADRTMKSNEYRRLMEILKTESADGDIVRKYGIPALANYQFHMIARVDDATQSLKENLKPHDNFPDFALKTRLNWSKNVLEERDAPFQAVLASMDHVYCVHLSLALWLELHGEQNPNALLSPYLFAFSNDNEVPSGGNKAKSTVQSIVGRLFQRAEFQRGLGTHSWRKHAATDCRGKGATQNELDIRGRWRSAMKRRISDVYVDVELPYPDTKVAALLCIGGPCKYSVQANSGITNNWVLEKVVPHARLLVSDETALVLGRALLWYAFTLEGSDDIPAPLLQRIQNAYNELNNNLQEGMNPVLKVPVIVTGQDAQVFIDEIPDIDAQQVPDGGNNNIANNNPAPIRSQLVALQSQLMALRRAIDELRNEVRESHGQQHQQEQRHFQIMNSNIRRIAVAPARGRNVAAGGNNIANQPAPVDHRHASLSSTPRCLWTLWAEYMVGSGGRKAAREFTPTERGRVKHKYTRRKVVWETILRLMQAGLTSDNAIDRIYAVYGQELTVTEIINRMLRDRRSNTIPAALR
jgi:hypothetical protein